MLPKRPIPESSLSSWAVRCTNSSCEPAWRGRRSISASIGVSARASFWPGCRSSSSPCSRDGRSRSRDSLPERYGRAGPLPRGLPLLILAEKIIHERLRPAVRLFVEKGIVRPADRPRFDGIVSSTMRWRNSVVLELAILAFVFTVGHTLWVEGLALHGETWSIRQGDGRSARRDGRAARASAGANRDSAGGAGQAPTRRPPVRTATPSFTASQ